MKKMDLGQTISILANIGVIGGIVFLAVELRQNNEMLDVELRANSQNRVAGITDLVLENPYLLELLRREPSSLSPSEHDALVVLGIRNLNNFENSFEEVRRGLRNEEALVRMLRAVWSRPYLNYGMPLAWPTFKERASPEFVVWMEQNVVGQE